MTATDTPTAESLIQNAKVAWRMAHAVKATAKQADEAIRDYLVGRRIRISGSGSPISGGTIHRDFHLRKTFRSELVRVTAVFYYFNEQYQSREDTFRVRTGDGKEYELTLSTTKFEEVMEDGA